MNHAPRSSPAELSSASHHLLRERKSSAPSHSSQPTLFTFDSPASHLQSTLSASAPQDYLFLHQCMSRKSENARYWSPGANLREEGGLGVSGSTRLHPQ